jgi:MFS family permease
MALTWKRASLAFVVLMGIVSLFSDMTYEGARSITGQFLALLGASGATIGFISGFGEFIGYAIRLVSGYIGDRTKRYWTIIFFGYAVNLISVPLLALTKHWKTAALLIFTERLGKAIRTPIRDAMLSNATQEIGHGWGFGLHEFLDQLGALLGPLAVSLVLYFKYKYRICFLFLFIPAISALSALTLLRLQYPNPRELEKTSTELEIKGFSRTFWFYLFAVALIAISYIDFPLIAYHLDRINIASREQIPIFYAAAMGVSSVSALSFGYLFDRIGFFTTIIGFLMPIPFAPLIFLGNFYSALIGVVIWGIGIGAQESIMRATVAKMSPIYKRGSAYGIFHAWYGIFWFLGSTLMGVLYDTSTFILTTLSVLIQLTSIFVLAFIFYVTQKNQKQ